jgi:hypothetical protein
MLFVNGFTHLSSPILNKRVETYGGFVIMSLIHNHVILDRITNRAHLNLAGLGELFFAVKTHLYSRDGGPRDGGIMMGFVLTLAKK